jgi:ADP-ribosylglycohydrolase/catechol 2,3-dioxygenase-like lactoylglutathione lyase family enzyme
MSNDNHYTLNRASLISKAKGAFLGAAVGDALGWPQEMPGKTVGKKVSSPGEVLSNGFPQWLRKSGSRFYLHTEAILPGEYSDDTQLILCTARSLLYGEQWWQHLTKREFPAWTGYERGGGGATNRAAQEWLTGLEPWSSSKRKLYFEAGGNGVAMRILPHCLVGVAIEDFGVIAKKIVANGICTHGHPRALIGALSYGFALWSALRETNTLQYGAVIEKVLSGVEYWSVLPDLDYLSPTWKPSAREVNDGQYKKHWQTTVEEMLKLLESSQEAMKQGALSVEREVLDKFGCFGKNKGSGTITAAASLFLASRYAAAPLNGLVAAAFANGADTDTMASMTGGLLGAIAGTEWLGDFAEQVQDAPYLKKLAEHLIQNQGTTHQIEFTSDIKTTRKQLDLLIEKLEASKPGDIVLIPDGREAQTSAAQRHSPIAKATLAVSWKLTTTDGQSLYIKKLSRVKIDVEPKAGTSHSSIPQKDYTFELQPVNTRKVAMKLVVRDLVKSQFFYENVLGLKLTKKTDVLVQYDTLALVPFSNERNSRKSLENLPHSWGHIICLEVDSIDNVYNNVLHFGSRFLQPISEKNTRSFFTCLDPDGNTVEIYEVSF